MATYQDIVDASLRVIGHLKTGQSAGTVRRTEALDTFNRMLGRWSAEMGPIHVDTLDTLTLTASDGEYTIGTSGNINAARPQTILSAHIRDDDTDYPVTLISHQRYQEISDKATTGVPAYLAYQPTNASSLGTIFLHPVPDAAYSLRLLSLKPLVAGVLATTVTLPPGYEEAFVYGLAVRLGIEYGKPVDQLTYKLATDAKRALSYLNFTPQAPKADPLAPGRRGRYNPFAYIRS